MGDAEVRRTDAGFEVWKQGSHCATFHLDGLGGELDANIWAALIGSGGAAKWIWEIKQYADAAALDEIGELLDGEWDSGLLEAIQFIVDRTGR